MMASAYNYTLTGIKCLIEIIEDGSSKLSMLLAGYPKLRHDLCSPTMEEIDDLEPTLARHG